jgi:hypothetical protein
MVMTRLIHRLSLGLKSPPQLNSKTNYSMTPNYSPLKRRCWSRKKRLMPLLGYWQSLLAPLTQLHQAWLVSAQTLAALSVQTLVVLLAQTLAQTLAVLSAQMLVALLAQTLAQTLAALSAQTLVARLVQMLEALSAQTLAARLVLMLLIRLCHSR